MFFDHHISGHRLEYIHHLYNGSLEDMDNKYIFALPNDFKAIMHSLIWPEAANIHFHFFPESDLKTSSIPIHNSYLKSKLIKKIAVENEVNELFLVSLMEYVPLVVFVLPKAIKISGIIYLIHLYRWKKSSLRKKVEDTIKYLILSKYKQFNNVFLLNDKSASAYLNSRFKTEKFKFLPDPFSPLDKGKINNIREELDISTKDTVYVHLGAMTYRKGTLKILKAIEEISQKNLENKTFIFAGKVNDDIKTEFYNSLNIQAKRVKIVCFDDFCEYSFLGSLCKSANYILLPYSNVEQSSGFIGYAAYYKTPVVVPNKGLLGKLVKRYRLGVLLNEDLIKSMIEFIRDDKKVKINHQYSNKYLKNNSLSEFKNSILFHLTN